MLKRYMLSICLLTCLSASSLTQAVPVESFSTKAKNLIHTTGDYLKKLPLAKIGLVAVPGALATAYYQIMHRKNIQQIREDATTIVLGFTEKIAAGQKSIESITFEEIRAFDAAREVLEMSDEELQAKIDRQAIMGATSVGIIAAIIYGVVLYKKISSQPHSIHTQTEDSVGIDNIL